MTYHYTMCGLDYVHLVNGYKIHETDYGTGVSIENSDDLDHAISFGVLRSHARLRGQEVRFLRSLLDLSQTQLGMKLGNKRLTIQRWEARPSAKIPMSEDRLLRLFAAKELHGGKVAQDILDSLEEFADDHPTQICMHYGPAEKADVDEPLLFPESAEYQEDDGWVPELKSAA